MGHCIQHYSTYMCILYVDPLIGTSTLYCPMAETSVRRKKSDGSIIDVRCPQAIVDYNRHMGGIVLGDSTGATTGPCDAHLHVYKNQKIYLLCHSIIDVGVAINDYHHHLRGEGGRVFTTVM